MQGNFHGAIFVGGLPQLKPKVCIATEDKKFVAITPKSAQSLTQLQQRAIHSIRDVLDLHPRHVVLKQDELRPDGFRVLGQSGNFDQVAHVAHRVKSE